MRITHLLSVAPVTDLDAAVPWYERLLGRAPDLVPMAGLAEWGISADSRLQVFVSPEHAGRSLLNFAVEDLDASLAELADRGLTAGDVRPGAQKVRFAALEDPDGNRITLIENPVV
jgi:catechol 2,3-dioxygenase-like lactoylglutathione lyase family enzyme